MGGKGREGINSNSAAMRRGEQREMGVGNRTPCALDEVGREWRERLNYGWRHDCGYLLGVWGREKWVRERVRKFGVRSFWAIQRTMGLSGYLGT